MREAEKNSLDLEKTEKAVRKLCDGLNKQVLRALTLYSERVAKDDSTSSYERLELLHLVRGLKDRTECVGVMGGLFVRCLGFVQMVALAPIPEDYAKGEAKPSQQELEEFYKAFQLMVASARELQKALHGSDRAGPNPNGAGDDNKTKSEPSTKEEDEAGPSLVIQHTADFIRKFTNKN